MSHFTRRHFVKQQAFGIGGLALSWLLGQQPLNAAPPKPLLERPTFDLKPRPPARVPQATAMISLFMQGAGATSISAIPSPSSTNGTCKTTPATLNTTTSPRPAPSCLPVLGNSR